MSAIEPAAEAPAASTRAPPPPWAALGAFAPLALLILDVAAVPAALPSLRVDLGSSSSGLLWIQEAYLLAFAAALVVLAEVGAALGRRALATTGVVLFAGGALLASTADSTAAVVFGRALQGAGGAALLAPALESLPRATGERRGIATALAAAALLGLAVAPVLGGAVAEVASWRWLFAVEALAAAPALLLLGAGDRGTALDRSPRTVRATRPRAALVVGLLCAVTGLIQGEPWGWASLDTIMLLATGTALLVFAWRDGHSRASPIAAVMLGCLCAALLLAPQYFDLARGLSPLRSGLLAVAVTGVAAIAAVLVARRTAARPLLPAGFGCAALGALGATRLDPASSYALVVLSLGLLGAGLGAAAGALAKTLSASPPPALSVVAGAALVLAAAGALFQHAQVHERDAGGSFEDALASGSAASAALLAALLAIAALVAWKSSDRLPTTAG